MLHNLPRKVYTQSMRRVFFIFFLLFFVVASLSPLYAQTPPVIPSGIIPGDGIPLPGITCGVAGDSDPAKIKCCVPQKQDNSILTTIYDVVSPLPVVGGIIKGIVGTINSISGLQNNIAPCIGDPNVVVPSTPNDIKNKMCICIQKASVSSTTVMLTTFCDKYFPATAKNNEVQKCASCMNSEGFYTALGCVPLNIATFITSYVLTTGIGIAGGIALLCIIYSAFRMQTSMGNAEAIKKAQENMTACITGLIVIIFSVLILKIIGVDILRIPGFN